MQRQLRNKLPNSPPTLSATARPPPSRLKMHTRKSQQRGRGRARLQVLPKHRGVDDHGALHRLPETIWSKIMEMFGFFCSPLCKNKADLQGIAAPVYRGKVPVEARFWRKTA